MVEQELGENEGFVVCCISFARQTHHFNEAAITAKAVKMDCQNFQKNGNMVRIPQQSSFGKRQHLSVCFLFVLIYCKSFLFAVESHAQNVDTFEISVGQTIGADQPVLGSGHIEEEGGQDIYLFEGRAGQTVFLEMLAHEASFRQMIWSVTGPDGKILALECFRCQDP